MKERGLWVVTAAQRFAARGLARQRLHRLRDQPAGSIALSRSILGQPGQERRRRCVRVGQHRAHRPQRTPPGPQRLRTRASSAGVGPRSTGGGLESTAGAEQAPLTAARVLPVGTGDVRRCRRSRRTRGLADRADARPAARLLRSALTAALTRAGRQRGIPAEVERIWAGLRGEQLRQPPTVEDAMGEQALAYLRSLSTAAENTDRPDTRDRDGRAIRLASRRCLDHQSAWPRPSARRADPR